MRAAADHRERLAAGRLAVVHRFLPLAVIETSHIAGSLAGAALLLLSQGLARRLVTAYYLTTTILALQGMAVAALFALQRLLRSDRGSL